MRTIRATLPERDRIRYSIQIQNRLFDQPLYREADEVYCYVSFEEEVITYGIMDHVWKSGRRLAVPKILTENTSSQRMEFFYIESLSDLKHGFFGIPEPDEDNPVGNKSSDKNVLVIMPGVAFDKSLRRIGYGRGFYDSYLRHHPDNRTIALAYSVQCLDVIPGEKHDIRPEIILTERNIYTC